MTHPIVIVGQLQTLLDNTPFSSLVHHAATGPPGG